MDDDNSSQKINEDEYQTAIDMFKNYINNCSTKKLHNFLKFACNYKNFSFNSIEKINIKIKPGQKNQQIYKNYD